MGKPKEILELEKIYGITLTEIATDERIIRNSYQLNTDNKVIILNLHDNQINEIKGLENLSQLKYLNLSYNQITEIKGLENLTQLKYLYLYNNQINEIKGLECLTQLQKLYLSNNRITDIKGLECLTQLQRLDLDSNQITEINGLENIIKIKTLIYLRIENNFFSQDFPVLETNKNHFDAIRKYFSDQKLEKEKQKTTIQLPAKVMLWGNHTVGKSTFWHYFNAEKVENFVKEPETESTQILNVHKYRLNESSLPEAMIYDFGGQDYYHGLYQAFFSEDSVNVLLWNTDTNKNESKKANDPTKNLTRHFKWDYWLYQLYYALKKRKQENENSGPSSEPILLVQTYAEKKERQNYTGDMPPLEIVDTFFVSLDKKELLSNKVFQSSLNYLKESLLREIAKKREKSSKEFDYYEAFLKYILSSEETGYISVQKLINENHYTRKKQESESDADFLSILRAELSELYQKGLVLYYNKKNLNDVVWLNPAKTVEHIYSKVLSLELGGKEHGVVPEKKFEIDEKIKQLLISEKVIFFDKHEKNYIIPGYLPLSEENEYFEMIQFGFTKPDFVLKFKHFIPFGLINQLICLYGNLPDKKLYWRDQLIFTFAGSYKVWIRLHFSELKIEVYIIPGQEKQELPIEIIQKAIFLNIIDLYWNKEVEYFDEKGSFDSSFSDAFEREPFAERVKKYIAEKEKEDKNRLIEDLYISVDNKYFVQHEELEKMEEFQSNIAVYAIKENTQELDTVSHYTKPVYLYRNFSNNNKIKSMKKIFISYSKEDIKEMNEFKKHTVTLQEQGLIAKPWTDEWISFGNEWDDEIKRRIKECDIMVCLISVDFLNTEYIRKVELQEAMKQGKILVPIVIKPCDWENCDFAKFQVAHKGKCICLNENQEYSIKENTDNERAKFWVDIIKEMRIKIFNETK